MSYTEDIPQIPTAAITIEDAELLQRFQNRLQPVQLTLYMEATTLPNTLTSFNILAQVNGSTLPEQIVVIGGHLDSWDVGTGAEDDGGGLISAWQAAKIINDLINIGDIPRPKRTIRVVLWTNEELGSRGAIVYNETHFDELPNHIASIESDEGNIDPYGFAYSGSDDFLKVVNNASSFLNLIEANNITVLPNGGGCSEDNSYLYPIVPCMSLLTRFSDPLNGDPLNARYFFYHHTNADTITALNLQGVQKSVATMAVMAYFLADS